MKKLLVIGLIAAMSLTANAKAVKKGAVQKSRPLEVNIIHINDHHSHLEEEKIGLSNVGFDLRSMQHERLYSRLYMS